jgi:putative AbiEi antitoxin of type IV toxin-antitoxin system/uncharacterized protein DUF559
MGPEGRLLQVAKSQHLVFTHGQALDVGMSPRTIRRRVEDGRWRRIHKAVYLSSGAPFGWQQRVMGACLACGPEAAASYTSAELVWRFTSDLALEVPHVTIRGASYRRHPGIVVHRCYRLDAISSDGFRVTHPMRTLLDLAPHRPEETIERYVDDAHRRGLVAVRRFQHYLDEPDISSRPGADLLREILSYRDPDAPIDSDLETIFFRVLRGAGLPLPVPQHPVMTRNGEKFIDFAYPDEHLAIELDGYATRANRQAFDYDRARQNDVEELGWTFRRFTWTQVRAQPAGVACSVGLALGLRPVRWKPR